jgi:AAA domain
MLPRVGVAIVWGKPKSGKTFWVFDLEMHIALGWDYRGRRVEQGNVLHIACEGVAGLGTRKEAWRLHHIQSKNVDEIELVDEAPFYLCQQTALDLIADLEKVSTDILVQFGDRPIRVITIDTLNRSLRGSESKDEDMGAYLRAAIWLADKFQCLVLIIHHCGWNEDRPRGHSSLLGNSDTLIEIKKDADGAVCSTVEEMRDGPSGAQTRSHLMVVDVTYDDNNNPITSCVIVETDPATNKSNTKTQKATDVSPRGKLFFNALANAAATPGIGLNHYEAGNRMAITKDQWIAELERRGCLDPAKADDKEANKNRRTLLSKYRLELLAAKWMACNGQIVWPTREAS